MVVVSGKAFYNKNNVMSKNYDPNDNLMLLSEVDANEIIKAPILLSHRNEVVGNVLSANITDDSIDIVANILPKYDYLIKDLGYNSFSIGYFNCVNTADGSKWKEIKEISICKVPKIKECVIKHLQTFSDEKKNYNYLNLTFPMSNVGETKEKDILEKLRENLLKIPHEKLAEEFAKSQTQKILEDESKHREQLRLAEEEKIKKEEKEKEEKLKRELEEKMKREYKIETLKKRAAEIGVDLPQKLDDDTYIGHFETIITNLEARKKKEMKERDDMLLEENKKREELKRKHDQLESELSSFKNKSIKLEQEKIVNDTRKFVEAKSNYDTQISNNNVKKDIQVFSYDDFGTSISIEQFEQWRQNLISDVRNLTEDELLREKKKLENTRLLKEELNNTSRKNFY